MCDIAGIIRDEDAKNYEKPVCYMVPKTFSMLSAHSRLKHTFGKRDEGRIDGNNIRTIRSKKSNVLKTHTFG